MKDNTISVDSTTTTTAYSGLRRGALIGYRWVLLAFLLLGVVQIFLAGVGIFSLDGQELGATGETAFNPHRSLGFGMGGLALIILILALIARPGARSIVLAWARTRPSSAACTPSTALRSWASPAFSTGRPGGC